MIVTRADEVEGLWTLPPHRRQLKVLLSPALQKVSQFLSVGLVIIPPGEAGHPHRHIKEQEAWYIISGQGKLRVGQEEAVLAPDTLVVAPPGEEHQIINDGQEILKALFFFTPAGPEEEYLLSGDKSATP
ncbi:MAG: cupin domain-containing protein [Candidatus Methanomethyliaceae archaeon]